MAIMVLFTTRNMTTAKYDEIVRRLEAAGAGAPPGRLHHTCYGDGTALRVADVFDSPESMQRFGEALTPILQEVGVDPGEPEVLPIHNVITG